MKLSGGNVVLLSNILVLFVALLHFYFLVLEMFFWKKPLGLRVFGQTLKEAEASAVLAANQGLYNGFLAAGLVWGLAASNRPVEIFFLSCVIVAGVFGGFTAKRTILIVQALPGALALASVLWIFCR